MIRNSLTLHSIATIRCRLLQISAETSDVLIEVTSSKTLLICKQVMETLIKELLALAVGSPLATSSRGARADSDSDDEDVGNHLVVEQVRVVDMGGHLKTVYPSRIDLVDVPCHVQRD